MYRRCFLKSIVAGLGALGASTWLGCVRNHINPPNILLILADDMGYSDIGCYGSEIPTPNIDRLGTNGTRMTRFYNAARCCPTRASLLTGLYPHQAGMGSMVEGLVTIDGKTLPGYLGYLNDHCVTLAEVLKTRGYHTLMSGKWHVGNGPQHWPDKRGFDRSYVLIHGAANYFTLAPWLYKGQETLVLDEGGPVTPDDDFYLTNEFTDNALRFLEERPQDQPFFMYLAYTAPHWPLHALPEDIALFKGKYKQGWNDIREQRFNKMKALGILTPECQLSPEYENPGNPVLTTNWQDLTDAEREDFDTRMAVHAAMIYRMDQGIGRIMDKLEREGELDNTLIMFLSDNGATKAVIYMVTQWIADRSGPIGSAQSFDSQGPKWANASNTPLQYFKTYTSEGGINTPFIAHFPGIIPGGGIDHTPAHVMDIMPTVLELTGADYPLQRNGKDMTPLPGVSLLPLLRGKAAMSKRPLCFEHHGHKAVIYGDWKLLFNNDIQANPEQKWILYNLKTDRTEMYDLSDQYPDKARELLDIYLDWEKKVGVHPYADTKLAREM